MENEATTLTVAPAFLKAKQVYAMAMICLVIGLAIGYMMRSSQLAIPTAQTAAQSSRGPTTAAADSNPHHPSHEEMHVMADKQAAPLLEKLKTNPNDSTLLGRVNTIAI